MRRQTAFAYFLAVVTAAAVAAGLLQADLSDPLTSILFWSVLLAAAELLPVSMGFTSEMTMSFPIHIALAILFPPGVAMLIAGAAAFDWREVRGQLPFWRALFNRAQIMLAVGAAAAAYTFGPGEGVHPLSVVLTALTLILANLGLVAIMVSLDRGVALPEVLETLIPRPVASFLISNALLSGLGAGTAVVYEQVEFGAVFVSLIFIPLLFARISIISAREKVELSERVQKQQQALLRATEKIFEEREAERNRIAEDIHDSSLQSLAAASYGCGNALSFIAVSNVEAARHALGTVHQALDCAMRQLRESLADLRRSSVESGGLRETVESFADQISTWWGAKVVIDGTVEREPPVSVALAAYQILQEALVNAVKHGSVNTVMVNLSERDTELRLVVQDDGTGFDVTREAGLQHHGMRLMRERAEQVGGELVVTSAPGQGTRVEAILPGGVSEE